MERHEISDINLMTSCEEKVREVLEKEDDWQKSPELERFQLQ